VIELNAGDLDRVVRFSRAVEASGVMDAGKVTLVKVAEVRGEIRDDLPSRSRESAGGSGSRSSRLRIRFRTDITADLLVVHDGRVRRIVSGPSEIGRRAGLEMMIEDYSPQGLSA
jgi:head-tail adaptor